MKIDERSIGHHVEKPDCHILPIEPTVPSILLLPTYAIWFVYTVGTTFEVCKHHAISSKYIPPGHFRAAKTFSTDYAVRFHTLTTEYGGSMSNWSMCETDFHPLVFRMNVDDVLAYTLEVFVML